MICFPNAKINLGLNVVSKRQDGYHNLETVFYPLKIYDALEIIANNSLSEDQLHLDGLPVDGNLADNLVMKALRLMRERYNFPLLDVHLMKKIPFGAGLGGGSADASFMLQLINDKFSLNIPNEKIAEIALKLGADCPFFIYNKPLFATGVGEVFEDVQLSLKDYFFVLVKPDVFVSTKDAFGGIDPKTPQISLKNIIKKSVEEWRGLMENDFEKTVFAKHPEIAQVKAQLYSAGAAYASMSGSGSSVYGIFRKGVSVLFDNQAHFIIEA